MGIGYWGREASNQEHLCENNITGERSEVSSETGTGWLPGAAVLNCEVGGIGAWGSLKAREKNFSVIRWATGVIMVGSTLEGDVHVSDMWED